MALIRHRLPPGERERPFRRKLLVMLIAVALATTAAAGCGGGAPRPPATRHVPAGPGTARIKPLEMHVVDVGQGDGIVLLLPKGTTVVVDTGVESDTMVNYLLALGIKAIDHLIITHPHADHIGGAQAILSRMPVRKVYDPGTPHTIAMYRDYLETLLKLVDQGKTMFQKARAGDVAEFEPGVKGVFLNPGDRLPEGINDCSLVLRIAYGNVSFLLTGDIEKEAEQAVLGRGRDIRSTVLKVAHHGSKSSSSSRFLDAVRPEVAVISVGKGNPYGYPHGEVLARLKQVGARVFRTDLSGTVKVITDGQTYKVEVTKSQ